MNKIIRMAESGDRRAMARLSEEYINKAKYWYNRSQMNEYRHANTILKDDPENAGQLIQMTEGMEEAWKDTLKKINKQLSDDKFYTYIDGDDDMEHANFKLIINEHRTNNKIEIIYHLEFNQMILKVFDNNREISSYIIAKEYRIDYHEEDYIIKKINKIFNNFHLT